MKLQAIFSAGTLAVVGANAQSSIGSSGLQAPDTGSPAWNAAISKASALIARASLSELNNITYGFGANNGCSGNSGSIPRLNYPGICLHDGPAGPKGDLVTGFASGVSVAVSWNRKLAGERGYWMGREAKLKGVQALNGPVVGPLGRVATGGRNWEGFGADPYLAGALGAETVTALQKSVVAVVKHYILNEQEYQRYSISKPAVSSNVDDQTLHEIYVAPFQDTIKAGAAAIMCAYNRVNNTYACEDDRTLNQVLKDELNFPGFVVSDWVFAQKSGVKSAQNGLDMAMPDSNIYWANNMLANAVNGGKLAKSRLEDMARRILSAWYLITGPESGSLLPGAGLPKDLMAKHKLTDAREPGSRTSTHQSAVEGHVLVKNINNALPLKSPKLMSIFGYDSQSPAVNNVSPSGGLGYSAQSAGWQSVNVSDGDIIQGALGNFPANKPLPQIADQGTLLFGGGSGAVTPSYWIDPLSALTYKARKDQTSLYWDIKSIKPLVAQSSEACLVFINQFRSEVIDIPGLHDAPSDSLVKNVASQCSNTVVVIHNAWIRLVDAWIDHPNVTAVVFAHLPGQESGEALIDVLYGTTSPSGRLAYTVAKNETDYGNLLYPTKTAGLDSAPQSTFSEGINIDYRHFLNSSIKPRFPFGYGLTYSSFKYSGIKAQWDQGTRESSPPSPKVKVPGGTKSLFDKIASVSATVQNTGKVSAAEVAQLYVKFPGDQKVRHLRGFSKDTIEAGKSVAVKFDLTRRDLSRWNIGKQSWQLQGGQYQFYVGPNVEDAAALTTTLTN